MTRKKLGLGLIESFSEPCEHCAGRGIIIHHDPVTRHRQTAQPALEGSGNGGGRRGRGGKGPASSGPAATAPRNNGSAPTGGTHAITEDVRKALAQVAASTVHGDHENNENVTAPDVAPAIEAEKFEAEKFGAEKPDTRKPEAEQSKVEQASVAAAEAAVAILDIPVAKSSRSSRRISTKDAEQILDSVLEALPEPKQPGQGRSRVSRRATSSGSGIVTSGPTSE
jgi:ribonuclease E